MKVEPMNFYKMLLVLGLISLSSHVFAFEILSKADSQRTFNKSLSEWKSDARILLESKKGDVLQGSEISITMIVPVSNSILKVTPVYKEDNLERAWKIAVAVEQNKELSKITKALGDVELRKLANKWYKEMMPEYTVMTEFDTVGDILQINFSIFEFGTNKIIDEVGRETNGCWQGCIKK
jgi:hypothetical protein